MKVGDRLKKPREVDGFGITKKTLLPTPSKQSTSKATHKEVGCLTDPLFKPLDDPYIFLKSQSQSQTSISSISIHSRSKQKDPVKQVWSIDPIVLDENTIELTDTESTVCLTNDPTDSEENTTEFIDTEAKTIKDPAELQKDFKSVFGTDSDNSSNSDESDRQLIIDENGTSSEEEYYSNMEKCEMEIFFFYAVLNM